MKVRIPRIEVQPTAKCSLKCVSCQHVSPQREQAREPDVDGSVYRSHLARLWAFAEWRGLFIGGGEPFLSPDLPGFLDTVHDGPWGDRRPDLITNGFWLLRADWRDFPAAVLGRIAVLIVSRYPTYVDRLGVAEWDRRIDALRADHPAVRFTSFHGSDPSGLTFTQNVFHSEPRPITADCAMKFCLELLPDGTIAKCPLGRALDLIPNATPEFRESYRAHSLYDLDRAGEGFAEFVGAEWHPACGLCGIATGDRWDAPWRSDTRVRTAWGEEYAELIQVGRAPG